MAVGFGDGSAVKSTGAGIGKPACSASDRSVSRSGQAPGMLTPRILPLRSQSASISTPVNSVMNARALASYDEGWAWSPKRYVHAASRCRAVP